MNIISTNGGRKQLEDIVWTKEEPLNMITFQLSKLIGKNYMFCKCGQLVVEENQCSECYIHSYTRTEEEGGDCPICYENEARWCELKCKHRFHMACMLKVKLQNGYRKCPLCRTMSDTFNLDTFDI